MSSDFSGNKEKPHYKRRMDTKSLDDTPQKDKLPESQEHLDEGVQLKRKVGLFSGVAFTVGCIIGSGIFITPGGVIERSGSVGLSLVIWAACGIISMMGALVYAELSTLIPLSGAEYAYYMDALGSLHPFFGPLPAFLYSWLLILLIKPASLAAACLSVAKYAVIPILDLLDIELCDDYLDLLMKFTGILFLGTTMALNATSVSLTMKISNTLTVTKLGAIAILIGCGIYQLCIGETQYLEQGFEGSSTDFSTIALAFYGVLWTYDGWNNLNMITEEIENPSVNLPRAIMIGMPLVTICYVSVNIAYLTVLSPEEMISSPAVAVDVGNRLLGPMAFIIPLCVVLSTFGSLLGAGFATARLVFASAREGHMVDILSFLHPESRTPIPSLIFMAILTTVMIVAQNLASLIDFCVFALWIFYVVSMILVLILRKIRPDAHRPYKVPIFIPIIMIVIGSYFIVAPIISNPAVQYLFILGAVVVGILVYIPFVYYKYSFGCMNSFTKLIQKLLNVGPPAKAAFD